MVILIPALPRCQVVELCSIRKLDLLWTLFHLVLVLFRRLAPTMGVLLSWPRLKRTLTCVPILLYISGIPLMETAVLLGLLSLLLQLRYPLGRGPAGVRPSGCVIQTLGESWTSSSEVLIPLVILVAVPVCGRIHLSVGKTGIIRRNACPWSL